MMNGGSYEYVCHNVHNVLSPVDCVNVVFLSYCLLSLALFTFLYFFCLHVGRGGSTFFKRHPCMYCSAQNGQLSTEAPYRCADCCEFDSKMRDLESNTIKKEPCIPNGDNFKDSQLHQFDDLKSSKCNHHEFLDSAKFQDYEKLAEDPDFAHLIGVKFPRTNNASNFTLKEWQQLGAQLCIVDNNNRGGKKFSKENWCDKVKDWKLTFEVNFGNLLRVSDNVITKVCNLFLHPKNEPFILFFSIAFIIASEFGN